jgi:hypothetical protein
MNRNLMLVLLVIALLIVGGLLLNVNQNLGSTQAVLTAAYVTATAGADQSAAQATGAAQAAATAQAAALEGAATAAATVQSGALAEAASAAGTAQARAINGALNVAATAAATAQSGALGEAADTAATAQARALGEAAGVAATRQSNAVINLRNGQATAQANAIANVQATAQANLTGALQQAAATAAAFEADLEATIEAQQTVVATLQATPAPATPVASASIPADWVRLEGYGVAVWMPPDWQGGDLRKNLDFFLDQAETAVPELAMYMQMFRDNPELFRLFAFSSTFSRTSLANMNIVAQPFPLDLPMQAILSSISLALPTSVTVIEDEVMQLGGREVGRLLTRLDLGGATTYAIQYAILEDGNLWIASFSSDQAGLEAMRVLGDQVIASIEFIES